MATSSYANLFGTTGAGQTGSQAGIGTLFGQQPKPQTQQQQQPAQTFAQLQQQGMARPAPRAPQGRPFAQFGGSQQAQQARTGMLSQLQQQLAQPTRFDTQAFQQIRQAQSAQLGAEYQAQQAQLNEELARRGLSASSIGGGRMGDLAGQQARALASLDAQLLQQAAQTQAQDRLAAMQAAGQFAELAGSQDLAQFEANRVAQAAQFQQALQGAQFEQGQTEFARQQALAAAQAQQQGGFQEMELGLRRQLGLGELGLAERRQTAQETQFGQSLAEQQAARQQQFGLSGRELDLRAQQIQQEGALQGRQLTIEEARLAAQQEQFTRTQEQQAAQFGVTTQLEQQRLAAQQQQFGAQLGFNREELALRGELGRNEQQLAEQRLSQEGRLEEARQAIQVKQMGQQDAQFQSTLGAEEQRFVRTLKEQQDARLQQLGVSTRELDLRAQQIKDEARLRGEEISNTKARDTAEIEYRGKALEQQATLAGQQITAEEARQAAQLQFQRDQMNVEDALRREGIAVDRERITSAESQFTRQLAETTAGRLGQQTQATLERQLREQLGLSEIAGVVYARDAAGNLVPATDEQKKQVQTLAARQMAQQQAQFTSQLGETTAARLAQTTQAQQELAFRQQMAQAEITGSMDIPVLGADGRPTGQVRRVSSLAASRLGMEGTQLALQQASQLSQQTGFAYTVGDDGKPTQLLDPVTKAPIRTESSAARLSQQELQQAELRGYIEVPDPTNPGKTMKVDTLAAKNLSQQQLNFLAEQASQRSQQSGFVFGVNANGQVEQVMGSDGQPIRTESAAARLSQQELQRAEIRGYFEEPNPNDPTKPIPVSTMAAKQLTQTQLQNAIAQADAMSRQSGMQYEVTTDAQGMPKIEQMYARDAQGNRIMTQPLTTAAAQAQAAQERLANADRQLRERLGLAEISGIIYSTNDRGEMVPSTNQTMARQQLNQGRADALTQATGIMHMVNEKDEVVPRIGADGKPITTANIQQMNLDRALRERLGMAEYTGTIDNRQTIAAQQAQQQLLIQLASVLAGSSTGVPKELMDQLNKLFGVTTTPTTPPPTGETPPPLPTGSTPPPTGTEIVPQPEQFFY